MADDCCNSFGGRISITIDGIAYPPTDADVTIEPSNIVVDGGANQDGSAFYVSKPRLYAAEFEFRSPCDINYDVELRKCKVNATIREIDNSRSHLFTGCRFVGDIKYDLSTGKVTGGKLVGPQYQKVAG